MEEGPQQEKPHEDEASKSHPSSGKWLVWMEAVWGA